MGHFVFVLLHIVALLFGVGFLMLTIPLHLIYGLMAARPPATPAEHDGLHVRCPDCRELVRADASKCKHCGSTLTPARLGTANYESAALNIALSIGAIVGLALLVKFCGG